MIDFNEYHEADMGISAKMFSRYVDFSRLTQKGMWFIHDGILPYIEQLYKNKNISKAGLVYDYPEFPTLKAMARFPRHHKTNSCVGWAIDLSTNANIWRESFTEHGVYLDYRFDPETRLILGQSFPVKGFTYIREDGTEHEPINKVLDLVVFKLGHLEVVDAKPFEWLHKRMADTPDLVAFNPKEKYFYSPAYDRVFEGTNIIFRWGYIPKDETILCANRELLSAHIIKDISKEERALFESIRTFVKRKAGISFRRLLREISPKVRARDVYSALAHRFISGPLKHVALSDRAHFHLYENPTLAAHDKLVQSLRSISKPVTRINEGDSISVRKENYRVSEVTEEDMLYLKGVGKTQDRVDSMATILAFVENGEAKVTPAQTNVEIIFEGLSDKKDLSADRILQVFQWATAPRYRGDIPGMSRATWFRLQPKIAEIEANGDNALCLFVDPPKRGPEKGEYVGKFNESARKARILFDRLLNGDPRFAKNEFSMRQLYQYFLWELRKEYGEVKEIEISSEGEEVIIYNPKYKVSLTTFWAWLKETPRSVEINRTEDEGGRYSEAAPSGAGKDTCEVALSFYHAVLDGTTVDLHVGMGKKILKMHVVRLVDYFSGYVICEHYHFDDPSSNNTLVCLWLCLLKYHRLPKVLSWDAGPAFLNTEVEGILTSIFPITINGHRLGQPHDAAPVETSFKQSKDGCWRLLPQSTKPLQKLKPDPRRVAGIADIADDIEFEALHQVLNYHTEHILNNKRSKAKTKTRRELWEDEELRWDAPEKLRNDNPAATAKWFSPTLPKKIALQEDGGIQFRNLRYFTYRDPLEMEALARKHKGTAFIARRYLWDPNIIIIRIEEKIYEFKLQGSREYLGVAHEDALLLAELKELQLAERQRFEDRGWSEEEKKYHEIRDDYIQKIETRIANKTREIKAVMAANPGLEEVIEENAETVINPKLAEKKAKRKRIKKISRKAAQKHNVAAALKAAEEKKEKAKETHSKKAKKPILKGSDPI